MTTLVRWEPFRELASFQNEMSRWMNGLFDGPGQVTQSWVPALDVWETAGELVYAFDLPGIPEEKINVELEDSTLTVSGSRERTEMEDGRLFRYERPFGEFTRSVALPEGTDDVEARAHYANGVLEVHVQKREQSKPRQIAVTTTVEGTSTD